MTSYRIPEREIEVYLRRQDDRALWKPDAVISASFDRRLGVTDHPVERSQDVTDHVQVMPWSFMLTVEVSDLPSTGRGGPARLRDRLKWLETTAGSGRRVDIVTRRHGVFRGGVLSGIKFPIGNVSSITFDLELREVRIASVSSITISVDQVSTDATTSSGAPSAVDLGEQSTTSTTADTATAQESERDQSILLSLLEAL